MKNKVTAKIYVLGNDIDTDQIISAQYLNLLPTDPEERKKLGSYALAGLPEGYLPFIDKGEFQSIYGIIVAGKNFGCGSSREHAPVALEAAGIKAIIAQSYSRIFFRNSVNTGLLYPFETPDKICDQMETGDEVELDTENRTLLHKESGTTYQLNSLGDAEKIINCGGIFQYAKKYGTE